jgi:O-antigen biosynthesis protein WbqP
MYRNFLKRTLDILLSASSLLALSPLMAAVAILIKLEDGGSVLFRQERVGKNGGRFEFLKFRSMPPDAANVPKTEAGEIPITRIGKIIRRTNIDELPQLFNILRGDMSIVGPRPAIRAQEALCRLREQSGAIGCLPGLTGLAQVNAYDGMPESEKAEWDGKYAAELSFVADLKIIFRTVAYLTRKPPVY